MERPRRREGLLDQPGGDAMIDDVGEADLLECAGQRRCDAAHARRPLRERREIDDRKRIGHRLIPPAHPHARLGRIMT